MRELANNLWKQRGLGSAFCVSFVYNRQLIHATRIRISVCSQFLQVECTAFLHRLIRLSADGAGLFYPASTALTTTTKYIKRSYV